MFRRVQPKSLEPSLRLLLLACIFLAATCFDSTSEAAVQKPGADDLNIPKIDLLLSGGGLRASAFSYGVLAGLNEICVKADDAKFTEREKDDQGELKDCKEGSPLLDQVNIISAVSGGAITAAYYKTHREEFFEEFPKILKKANLQWRLLKAEKSPTVKRIVRSPVFLLTSIWDTITSIIGLPFSSLNVELTPIAVMALSDGLLESEQLTTVYRDLFYQHTRLGDLNAPNGFPFGSLFGTGKRAHTANDPILLINASDITNGTVFTFDERTFECMGVKSERENVELALAVAASSGLPGVFSPVRIDEVLKRADPLTIPNDCPPILGDRSHKPVLVDGGVTDNFGAIGLLRTVMKSRERTSSDGVSPPVEARKEKHLLLFINSEAESESKLPGLAGHFDASYDVLIRSKKDLVRVMATNMLRHFGIATVELRMADLVASHLSARQVLSDHNGSTEGRAEDKASRVLDVTEKEQKIERNLDQIGMIPSADEIETLVAMGKSVVSNRIAGLRESYSILASKRFNDNCATVANPDKWWCWPDQFRSSDLDSGGGSAFLRTLSEVTSDFEKSAVAGRHKMLREILKETLQLGQQETRNSYAALEAGKAKTLVSFIDKFTGQDSGKGSRLHEILMNAGVSQGPSADCQKADGDLAAALKVQVKPWMESKNWYQVWDQLKTILKVHSGADCFPEYHQLVLIPELMEVAVSKPSKKDLSRIIALFERGFAKTSPALNPVGLHLQLGSFLTSYYEAPGRGLEHLQIAIDLATQSARTLQDILNSDKTKDAAHRGHTQNKRLFMEFLKRVSELHWVYAVLVSPVPIGGKTSEVTDADIERWERKYLHDHRGRSLLDLIGTANGDLDNDHEEGLRQQIISLRSTDLQAAKMVTYLDDLYKAIKGRRKTSPTRSCAISIDRDRQDNELEVCRLVNRIREEIRLRLSQETGIKEAGEILQSVYSEYLEYDGHKDEPNPLEGLLPDILALRGLLKIREAMDQDCPVRGRTVRSAITYIKGALEKFENDDEVQRLQKLAESIAQTYNSYLKFADALGCSSSL